MASAYAVRRNQAQLLKRAASGWEDSSLQVTQLLLGLLKTWHCLVRNTELGGWEMWNWTWAHHLGYRHAKSSSFGFWLHTHHSCALPGFASSVYPDLPISTGTALPLLLCLHPCSPPPILFWQMWKSVAEMKLEPSFQWLKSLISWLRSSIASQILVWIIWRVITSCHNCTLVRLLLVCTNCVYFISVSSGPSPEPEDGSEFGVH